MISAESQKAAAKMLSQLQKYLAELPSNISVTEYQEHDFPATERQMIKVVINSGDDSLSVLWTRKTGIENPPGDSL